MLDLLATERDKVRQIKGREGISDSASKALISLTLLGSVRVVVVSVTFSPPGMPPDHILTH